MTSYLEAKILRRKKNGNFRQLKIIENLIDFSSNDYLGLARCPKLAFSISTEINTSKFPLNGSTGARLLTGNSSYVQELEDKIASFHGYEAGVLFNCGYMANLGIYQAVIGPEDIILFDCEVHASVHDGMRLCRAKAFPFRHNDLTHLENRLKNISCFGNRFISIESIYSTDGSCAPLTEICKLAQHYGAHVIVDEAHAVGVCGPNGRGCVAEHNLTSQVFAQVTTFGKALGTQGAIILGSTFLKNALINFANSYIFTTALSMYSLAAIKCSYDVFPKLEFERKQLAKLIQIYQQAYPNASITHIQSISIKGNERVKEFANKLFQHKFDIRPLMSPTVQQGHEKLRICLHAFNTEKELKMLLHFLD